MLLLFVVCCRLLLLLLLFVIDVGDVIDVSVREEERVGEREKWRMESQHPIANGQSLV